MIRVAENNVTTFRPPRKAEARDRDLDAEAAVLSALILEPVAHAATAESLEPDQFFSKANATIFDAIRSLHRDGTPVDLVTVASWLRARNLLRAVGGPGYVAQIADATPAVAHVDAHADLIRDCWRRRRLLVAVEQSANLVHAGGRPEDIIAHLRETLALVTEPAKKPATCVELLSSDDIFAELAPPAYLVDGAIRRGSLTLLGGYGSSGKTWLAVALLLAIGAGARWLDRFVANQGPALFLDYESGTYEARRRFQVAARGMRIATPVEGLTLASMPRLYLNRHDAEAQLSALASGRALIVIDSLRAACPGADENDSTIRESLDRIRAIAERTQCAFVVLVHSKKTNGEDVDDRESLRGSSAIFDAADQVLTVTYQKGKPLLLRQTKARHGAAIEPFEVTIKDTPLGTGVEIIGADIVDESSISPSARFERICEMVESTIRQHPGSSLRFIREHLPERARNDTVAAAVEHLAKLGSIKNLGTDRKQEWRPANA